MLTLGGHEPIECSCGLDYDPSTGKVLPVCEGFELPTAQDPRPILS